MNDFGSSFIKFSIFYIRAVSFRMLCAGFGNVLQTFGQTDFFGIFFHGVKGFVHFFQAAADISPAQFFVINLAVLIAVPAVKLVFHQVADFISLLFGHFTGCNPVAHISIDLFFDTYILIFAGRINLRFERLLIFRLA